MSTPAYAGLYRFKFASEPEAAGINELGGWSADVDVRLPFAEPIVPYPVAVPALEVELSELPWLWRPRPVGRESGVKEPGPP